MKITIEFDGVRRQIDGNFRICCGRDEAKAIIEALRPMASGFFGWVSVFDLVKGAEPGEPLKWAENVPEKEKDSGE